MNHRTNGQNIDYDSQAISILVTDHNMNEIRPFIDEIIKNKFNGSRERFASWFHRTFCHADKLSTNREVPMTLWNMADYRFATAHEALMVYKIQLKLYMRTVYGLSTHGMASANLNQNKERLRNVDPIGNRENLVKHFQPTDWCITNNNSVHKVSMADVLLIRTALNYGVNGSNDVHAFYKALVANHSRQIVFNYIHHRRLIGYTKFF